MRSKILPRRKHIFPHHSTDKTSLTTLSEKIAVYNNKSNYIRTATKYMFFANSGAITTLLLLYFGVKEYILPIIFFSVGIAYSIAIPIFLYFTTDIESVFYQNKKIINKKIKMKRTLYYVVRGSLIYFPIFVFIIGLIIMFWTYISKI